ETFQGRVGECFEKTLRYPGHFALIRGLYDLGLFSSEKVKFGKGSVAPREITSKLFLDKMSGDDPDITVLRVEAHSIKSNAFKRVIGRRAPEQILSFTLIDRFDDETGLTSMMRTTAWPASVVIQMLAGGAISKTG